ncbi:MAG: hypothetical protein ACK53V_07790, partial [Planctomycetota bacterium]
EARKNERLPGFSRREIPFVAACHSVDYSLCFVGAASLPSPARNVRPTDLALGRLRWVDSAG